MFNKKFKKNNFAENSHSVFEGLKGGPFEHTKTFFFFCKMPLIFFQHSKLFSQKYAGNKKDIN